MDFWVLILHKLNTFFANPETLKIFVSNRFLMILLIVVLLKMKNATYKSIYLSALVNIAGTFLHEMAHFLVGLFLNASPTKFDLWPKKADGGYIMGSVGFRNISFYNAVPSALAPLFLLVAGYYLNRWYFINVVPTYCNYTLYIFLQTVIIENAMPSSQDFKVAFSFPLGVIMYSVLLVLGIIYFL